MEKLEAIETAKYLLSEGWSESDVNAELVRMGFENLKKSLAGSFVFGKEYDFYGGTGFWRRF